MTASAILSWVLQLVQKFWNGLLEFLSSIVQFAVDLLVMILNLVVDAFFWIIIFAAHILPDVPDLPGSGSFDTNLLAVANYFFPVAEFLQGLTFIAAVYAGVGLYKLAKFIRGGG
ncbi:hypothetical protein [Deinococcus sp. S9]|uniref:hypothetical protein n=1 Tax=Deinococcus sp. S9 TaxID=2545754 RepID=UPI001055A932|nr:hypothetical protein [Deinococcus sp. S9]TDE84657.1 hypothetical protein E0686_16025 [Deinococcus sp. S9]